MRSVRSKPRKAKKIIVESSNDGSADEDESDVESDMDEKSDASRKAALRRKAMLSDPFIDDNVVDESFS